MITETNIDPDIAEAVPFFLKSRREDITLLRKNLEDRNFEGIQRIAHTIKGIATPYGFPSLEILSRELEENAKKQNPDATEMMIEKIQNYLLKFNHF